MFLKFFFTPFKSDACCGVRFKSVFNLILTTSPPHVTFWKTSKADVVCWNCPSPRWPLCCLFTSVNNNSQSTKNAGMFCNVVSVKCTIFFVLYNYAISLFSFSQMLFFFFLHLNGRSRVAAYSFGFIFDTENIKLCDVFMSKFYRDSSFSFINISISVFNLNFTTQMIMPPLA